MYFRQIFHRLKVLEFSILIVFVNVIISLSEISAAEKKNVLTQETYTFEQKFGIGLIKSSFVEGFVLKFYQNPEEKKTYKTIKLGNETDAIARINQNRSWLLPQINHPEYGYFLFLCRSRQFGWFELELSSQTKQTAWVKEEDGFVFRAWEEFLTEVYAIETDPAINAIHEQPNYNAPSLAFHEWATIDAIGHKGQWLEVKERFDEVGPPGNHQAQTGWLKWRDENGFLVKYSLSY